MLYSAKGNWGITGISPNQKAGDGKLDLSDVEMKIDPKKNGNKFILMAGEFSEITFMYQTYIISIGLV